MSETETAPQGGAEAEPAVTEEATAAVDPAAATETTETETVEKPSREDRRIARLTARLSANEQQLARQAAELETYRRNGGAKPEPEPIPQTPEELERLIDARAETKAAHAAVQARVAAFHETGRAAFPDWTERCQSLMQMGADPAFAEILVETPDGAKIAAALADDPEQMEAIAGLKSDRARAIALGRFAATLTDKPPPVQHTSKAPAPIRPIGGGGARVTFNEYTATAEQLTEYYAKQAMAARTRR